MATDFRVSGLRVYGLGGVRVYLWLMIQAFIGLRSSRVSALLKDSRA